MKRSIRTGAHPTAGLATTARRWMPGRPGGRRPVTAAVLTLLALPGTPPAWSQTLPAGPAVVHGQASVMRDGSRMTVTNSAGAMIDWQSFSVGAGAQVRFEQPSAQSQVLNRVIGREPSNILGQISSNGRVWLVNPYGVLFGASARVDVAGLVASTLNIDGADWRAGRFSLVPHADAAGALVNRGELRTVTGGEVLLLGGQGGVRNDGLIEAPGGRVMLAAGASMDLADSRTPGVAVRITAADTQVVNAGRIVAPGGRIDLQAAMVNQAGLVRADSLSGQGGQVTLQARDALELGAGSVTQASGVRGGRVTGDAPSLQVSGAVQATGSDGVGGHVQLTGRQIALLSGADIDVSGATGGGSASVGGSERGLDPGVPQAQAVYMDAQARIRADATRQGDGGRVVLWSTEATRAYGSLSARGGPTGGDGGFIETSGRWLDARPVAVRADAPAGRAGSWLLDPNDILVTDGGSDTHITGGPLFTTSDDSAVITTATIEAALNAGSSVVVSTGAAGTNTEFGDITLSGVNLLAVPSQAVSLTFEAARNIDIVASSLATSAAPLSLRFSAAHGGTGGIIVSSSSLHSGGGNIELGGVGTACGVAGCAPFASAVGYDSPGRRDGVNISSSTLSAGAGSIVIRGASAAENGPKAGITMDYYSSLSGRNITLQGWAGSAGLQDQVGVAISGPVTATHALSIDGTSAVGGPADIEKVLVGVLVDPSGQVAVSPSGTDSTASLDITGRSAIRSGNYDSAVVIEGNALIQGGASARIQGEGGDIALTGGSPLDAQTAQSLTLSGNTALWIDGDIQLPTGGLFGITTQKGVSILGGDIVGAPSSVSINTPTGNVVIGTLGGSASVDFGSAPATIRAQQFSMGTDSGSGNLGAGSLLIRADSVLLDAGASSLSATSTGNAIQFAGLQGNVASFINLAGSGVLNTPNGRWLIHATDPVDAANFDTGGLQHDFRQYGTTFGDAILGTGNGLVFSRVARLRPDYAGPPISKVYDGLTDVSVDGGVTLAGLVPGDSLVGTPGFESFRFADANAGTDIPILASLSGNVPAVVDDSGKPAYGYTYREQTNGFVGTINPKPVSVLNVTAQNKVYDGTATASLLGGTVAGLVGAETLTLAPGTGLFATPDAGTQVLVTGSVTLADGDHGGLARNYVLASAAPVSTRADILPRPLTLTALSVANKVYDGSTVASVSGGVLDGLVAGETLGVGAISANFDTPHAGTAKPVTADVVLADGTGGGKTTNYVLTGGSTAQGVGNVLPRPLTVSGLSADSKVYDGSREAVVKVGSLTGLVGAETLTVAATGQFATPDAGQGKTVAVTLSLADGASGGRASNYAWGAAPPAVTADVTPRPVTLTDPRVTVRPYDGTRLATLDGAQVNGLVAGEALVVQLLGGLFDSPDAGTGKAVTGTLALADGPGGRAANYQLVSPGSSVLTGTIAPRALTLTSVQAADKVYDGTNVATVEVGSLLGLVAGETLQFDVAGAFDTPDAGRGKTVTAQVGLVDGTGRAANYSVDAASVTTRADVLQRPLTLTGAVAADKPYDGTTAASFTPIGFQGLVAGQSLGLRADARFDTAAVGTGKPVVGTVVLADGAGGRASNYVLADPGTLSGTASITPRPLAVVSATAADKIYDGGLAAQVSNFELAGTIGNERVSVAAGQGSFASAAAGVGKPVTATATALTGPDAANYMLGQASVQTTASIAPATLTYVADPVVGATGLALPPLTGVVTGLVGSDTLGSATQGSLQFTTTATAQSPQGVYPVTGTGLTATNYVFGQAGANATALTMIVLPPSPPGESTALMPTVPGTMAIVLPVPQPTTFAAGRTLDVTQALQVGSGVGIGFRQLDLRVESAESVAMTLSARERYKRALFAEAVAELEKNPSLADAPACQTVEQAAAGNCLITEGLKPALRERILREEGRQVPAAPAPAVPPAVSPPPTVASAATSPSAATAPAAPPTAATPATPATPAPTPPVAAAAPTAPPVAAPALVVPAPPPVAAVRVAPPARLPGPRPVVSAALPQIQTKWALVIGTDDYVDARIPKLDNAVSDAVAVSQVFEQKLGYQTVLVRNGSKSAILRAFNQLAAVVSPHDSVIIYYAGHGELVEKTGLGYWQPADADPSRPQTWLSNTDIGKLLGQIGASQVALVSDSCFSGSLVSDERIRASGVPADVNALLSRRAAVVMSSGGNEPVFDAGKNGHSPFAWNLMRSLERVSAWRPGSNVFEQVRFAVARELPQRPQYGASRLGGHEPGADYVFEQRQLDGISK